MKTRFKGHETFYFREGWRSKALFEMRNHPDDRIFLGDSDIEKLGVGANMVKSIKYWMMATGLIQYNYVNKSYELTTLGQIISDNDIYLEDFFTLWLLHINLVRNKEMATTWNLFFNEFKADTFENIDAKNYLQNYLQKSEIKFNDNSLQVDINVLLSMYSKEYNNIDPEENIVCPLSRLGIIKEKRNQYTKNSPDLSELNELIVLYIIFLMMEDRDKNQKYISLYDAEFGNNSLGVLLNINRVTINEYLEKLERQSYIRIDRTAGLNIIYITTDEDIYDILRNYYERRIFE